MSITETIADFEPYLVFMLIAIVIGLSTAYYMLVKQGIWSKRILLLLLISCLAFFGGARLFHFFLNPDFYASSNSLFSINLTGFYLYGGLLFSFIVNFIAMHLLNINKWRFLDNISPSFFLSLAIMRIGCFLNGCCFGKVTTMPWGIAINNTTQNFFYFVSGFKDTRIYHPTQIYELLAALSISLLTFWLIRKKLPAGISFLIGALLFTSFRLINHYFLYIPKTMLYSGNFYPYLYVFLIIFLGLLIIYLFKKEPCEKVSV